ncbi:hypothetical protein VTK56DRAFT_4704 [Thermocarpiscus australiensis]
MSRGSTCSGTRTITKPWYSCILAPGDYAVANATCSTAIRIEVVPSRGAPVPFANMASTAQCRAHYACRRMHSQPKLGDGAACMQELSPRDARARPFLPLRRVRSLVRFLERGSYLQQRKKLPPVLPWQADRLRWR